MPLLSSQITNQISSIRMANRLAERSIDSFDDIFDTLERFIDNKLPLILANENEFGRDNRRRTSKLLSRINVEIGIGIAAALEVIEREYEDIIEQQIEFQRESYERLSDGEINLRLPSISQTRRETSSTPFINGQTVRQTFSSIQRSLSQRIASEVRNGIYSSANFRDVKRRILGSAIKDSGLTGQTQRQIRASARTIVNHLTNQSILATGQANNVEFFRFAADTRLEDITNLRIKRRQNFQGR